jgi:hypothetical protein
MAYVEILAAAVSADFVAKVGEEIDYKSRLYVDFHLKP